MKPIVNEETIVSEHPAPARRKWPLIVAVGVAVLGIATLALLLRRPASPDGRAGREVPTVESVAGRAVPTVEEATSSAPAPAGQADVTLPPEMMERVGLREEVVGTQNVADQLRTTGTVQPNAYRETRVIPLVGGRITAVNAQLGDTVHKGQPLAVIFSADLAEAQMQYRKVMADFDVFAAQHARAIKLAEIGAMSQQELEQAEAHYRQHHAEHEAAEQKLRLLGLNEKQIEALQRGNAPVRSEIPVESPSSGVITTRNINVGQVVSNSETLFSVTDLSTVWVIANIYEKDFAALRAGTGVTISAPSFPGRVFHGKVSYIDPRVDAQTRTAQARIEVPNPGGPGGGMLRLGMFVDVALNTAGKSAAVAVPKTALQTVGNESVVFVPLGAGKFQMRRVQVGQDAGEFVQVISGVNAGEKVVTAGSFFLRAEMARR